MRKFLIPHCHQLSLGATLLDHGVSTIFQSHQAQRQLLPPLLLQTQGWFVLSMQSKTSSWLTWPGQNHSSLPRAGTSSTQNRVSFIHISLMLLASRSSNTWMGRLLLSSTTTALTARATASCTSTLTSMLE